MANDREFKDEDTSLDPEDVNSEPSSTTRNTTPDPNDMVPVPGAMSAAEIDERAQTVEALRDKATPRRDSDDDSSMR